MQITEINLFLLLITICLGIILGSLLGFIAIVWEGNKRFNRRFDNIENMIKRIR
jgi:membrane protein DedA with SNARE-associated domain